VETVNLNSGLSVEQLNALIDKRDHLKFLNAKNEVYRERGMKENPPSREEAIRLMAEFPNLVKRPLLVKGGTILYGFKEEEWAG
jgi:arsenate reductase-like glutaredoxin family protein